MWDDILAAVGGAASGYESRRRFDKTQETAAERDDLARKKLELTAMLEQLKETGRNTRNTANETGRTDRNTTNETGRNTRAGQVSDDRRYGVDTAATTQRRGQDINEGLAWDASARWWEGDQTSRRGQ